MEVHSDDNSLYENPVEKAAFENFGIKYLFPWQRLVVSNILEAYEYHKLYETLSEEEKIEFNKDNDDSFCKGRQIVLLPTGAGKSLCFQLPALLFDGPTLVVYPLLALMSDQQRRMEEGSLRSVTFRGGQTEEVRENNFEKIKNGAQIIIVNPEVLQSEELVKRFCALNIKHIAIDESHTVSEWGKTFRPAYLNLGKVIKKINPPVITAFTATASPEVLKSVSEILFDGMVHVVRSESDRQNIHYFVRKAAAKKKEALALAATELHPMIIFCGTRDLSEDMAQELNVFFGRGTARFYHAGLSREEKTEVEKWFYESTEGVLCATCAYGMGVDKKNIKTVVHLETSTTAEAYIQEAGRGGRDGSIAKAILIWSLEDSEKFSHFGEKSREYMMKTFAETTDCRRQVLLDALGGEQAVCSGCDLCNEREELKRIGELQGKEKRKQLQIHKKGVKKCDWEKTFEIIRKAPNYYNRLELEEVVMEKFGEESKEQFGKNMWTHGEAASVVDQLILSGKVIEQKNIFWKNRLKINKVMKL